MVIRCDCTAVEIRLFMVTPMVISDGDIPLRAARNFFTANCTDKPPLAGWNQFYPDS
jgi:hypothetical protein